MTFTIRETCRLCDAKLPEERVLDLGETPLANALVSEWDATPVHGPGRDRPFTEKTYPLYLKQCSACGHVQLPVVVDPKLLFPADYPYASATGASMREHLALMARELTGIEPACTLVAEVGSNDGFLLSRFARLGWKTIGIDPALKLASSATRNGYLTVPEFFNGATAHAVRNACGPAQLIVANNVFAHADDLREIVEGVKVLLAPEGRFVFEVGWLASVLHQNNWPVVYHEHLSQHTVAALIPFLERHGLNLYDCESFPVQGGVIRCYVGRDARARAARVKDALEMERIQIKRELAGWQSNVERSARALAQKLSDICGSGRSVAGFGCSAKSTTLLHMAKRHSEHPWKLDFICDDAPTKQGRFSPGLHIPIVPGSWLEEKQPDYCVSLSGNFSEAFKAQHPGFKGEWIEPDLGGA